MGRLNRMASNDGGGALDLLEWCDETNRKPIMARMGRWYYVTEKDGREEIACLDNTDGSLIRPFLEGRLDNFVGWSENRMNGYRKWLDSIAQKGLLPAARQVVNG